MKHNAEAASDLVRRAIGELGGDFALTVARSHLVAALGEINKVQKKRNRREAELKKVEEAEKNKKDKVTLSRSKANQIIGLLDEMLKKESQQSGRDSS